MFHHYVFSVYMAIHIVTHFTPVDIMTMYTVQPDDCNNGRGLDWQPIEQKGTAMTNVRFVLVSY